jgi:hypothetical protein
VFAPENEGERTTFTMAPVDDLERTHARRVPEPASVFSDAPSASVLEPETALRDALYVTDSWHGVVRLLHDELGLSRAELARGAGVAPITVARWLEQGEDAEIRSPDRLSDLRYVVLTLLSHGAMSKKLLKFWLTAKDVVLGTDALTAIAHGRFEEVIEAGKALSSLRRQDA